MSAQNDSAFLRIVNVPVFGTPFTLGVVRNKLEESGLAQTARLHEIKAGGRIKLGEFKLEFIRVPIPAAITTAAIRILISHLFFGPYPKDSGVVRGT
mgnify:CR=1 FL=1